MSYPKKYRERTIEYRQEGHTLEETHNTFKVSISAIRTWEKQLKEKGHLEKKPLKRSFKKLDPEKLKAYMEENLDAYQKEIAEVFSCTDTAVRKAFKRLGITRKKRQNVTGNKTQ
jgi:transposase